MSIDKKDIERVVALNDEVFRAQVQKAVQSAGLDPRLTSRILKDSDKIKKTLQTLSDKDLEKLSETLKSNKLDSIEKIIKEAPER